MLGRVGFECFESSRKPLAPCLEVNWLNARQQLGRTSVVAPATYPLTRACINYQRGYLLSHSSKPPTSPVEPAVNVNTYRLVDA